MGKITRANIAAAKAQRDILIRRGQKVPERIQQIAGLDPSRLTAEVGKGSPLIEALSRPAKSSSSTEWSAVSKVAARYGEPPNWGEGELGHFVKLNEKFEPLRSQLMKAFKDPNIVIVLKSDLGTAGEFIHKTADLGSVRQEFHTGP